MGSMLPYIAYMDPMGWCFLNLHRIIQKLWGCSPRAAEWFMFRQILVRWREMGVPLFSAIAPPKRYRKLGKLEHMKKTSSIQPPANTCLSFLGVAINLSFSRFPFAQMPGLAECGSVVQVMWLRNSSCRTGGWWTANHGNMGYDLYDLHQWIITHDDEYITIKH